MQNQSVSKYLRAEKLEDKLLTMFFGERGLANSHGMMSYIEKLKDVDVDIHKDANRSNCTD